MKTIIRSFTLGTFLAISLYVYQAPTTPCPATFTTELIEGPYYRAGSPERTNLVESGTVGEKITLIGYVFGPDCKPIPGAWLDFWQADAKGVYDEGNKFRGHQYTDANGKYALDTVVPGEYLERTNHIHVKVAAKQGEKVVTTQLYFPGAKGNDTDEYFDQSMVIIFARNIDHKMARFDFKLKD